MSKLELSHSANRRNEGSRIRDFNIFAHPTGRLLGERTAYPITLEFILRTAKERGCAIELNAHPTRLDIDDHIYRLAKEMGVMVADAHSTDGLRFMRYVTS
jgi:DNA polymerase (family 10)